MNRREFITICQILGLSVPLQPIIKANASSQSNINNNSKPVIIIGAGAAGLTAGYLLQQLGIDFKILEASSNYGGRMKRALGFANFPIPLGAEWIHVKPNILNEIVNDNSVDINIETTMYKPELDTVLHEGEEISLEDAYMAEDSKFINATWYDFFEQYIVPSIENRIVYNAVVETIDYSAEKIELITPNTRYFADRVIVSAPVKILQNGQITFIPELPRRKQQAIDKVKVWSGCKAFIEFSEKFYPAVVSFDVKPSTAGEKLYYDAAYGQDTTQHVLGLFAVGVAADPYIKLSDDALIKYILGELDELSGGLASEKYLKHIFQNWNEEPYANGAYIRDDENWRLIRKLGENVADRLFFAGDAYTEGEDWSSVHTAVRSAKRAVKSISRL